GAKEFVANAEIERQVFADSIIILCEPGAGGDAVVVVAYATSRLAEERGSGQETLKVGAKSGDSVGKEQQSIVGHRKIAADGSAVNFTAEAELVRAVRPAQGVKPDKTVRERPLGLLREWTESKGSKCEAINIGITIRGGQIDSHLRIGDRRHVVQFVADDIDPETELIYRRVGEQMSLRHAAHPIVQWDIQREVQIVR